MRDLIPSCGRRLCCTLQRMQLVVMAAVLALAGARQGCSFGCHPTNISILVESCGRTELVYTTICEGQCYHEVTDDSAPKLFCLKASANWSWTSVATVWIFSMLDKLEGVFLFNWFRLSFIKSGLKNKHVCFSTKWKSGASPHIKSCDMFYFKKWTL